ncbi:MULTISPECIES: ribosome maturation factor RimM [Aeromicrobium]|uniref:Ribosome maturation factor RimM n=1 Tax=Aeromicrobium erythreum TaxID=2041 RepID=A0A0U3T1C9_9ACTN|nr:MULTISPECIES: ribosome maturation factor RimM [Aeromicrobium]ALX04520.1 ribosome maturation factor RimM [Aeromicrobium erythreum]
MRVVVGRIGRAHGIKGELAVQVRTDEPERRFAPGTALVAGDRTVVVAAARNHSGRLLLRLEGVGDRTAAEALHGRVLEVDVDPDDVPEDDDAYYDHQLVGLRVHDHAGTDVGVVADVLHLPEQDLLSLDLDAGARGVLVPFVVALVPDVDLGAGHVTLADVPGLLDPDAQAVAEPERAAGGADA